MNTPSLSERPCPACNTRTYTLFLEEKINEGAINSFSYASRKEPEFMRYKLVRCAECSCIYTPTLPQTDVLNTAYTESGYSSNDEALYAAKTYIRELAPFVGTIKQKQCAVDIGAGNGALLPLLQEKGFEKVIGIEPSKEAIRSAPENIQNMLHQGVFTKDFFKKYGVAPSLVCVFMTLEHVPHPQDVIEAAYTNLAPDGLLAIVIHNHEAWLNKMLGSRSPIIDIEHLQIFSPQAIAKLLERYGFFVETFVPFKNTYPLEYWIRLTPLPRFLKNILSTLLRAVGMNKKAVSFSVGNCMVIAKKKAL